VIPVLYSISNLRDNQLEEIKSLEKELGKSLLAFSCFNVEPSELEDVELSKIRDLETRLGLALVAVTQG
jgi:hypothetical protein